jgi:hypothetical protein
LSHNPLPGRETGPAAERRTAKTKPSNKKEWNQPKLTALGDVESLTLQKIKNFGGNDGFTLENQTISG